MYKLSKYKLSKYKLSKYKLSKFSVGPSMYFAGDLLQVDHPGGGGHITQSLSPKNASSTHPEAPRPPSQRRRAVEQETHPRGCWNNLS